MKNVLGKFYRFLLFYRKEYFFFLGVLLVTTIAENISPFFYKLFIEKAVTGEKQELAWLLLGYIALRVFTNLASALSYFLGDSVLIPAARDARITVFKRVQDLDFAFHVQKSTGSLISAFKRGDGAFFDLFHDLHFGILATAISSLVIFFFLGQLSPVFILLILLTILANLLLGQKLIKGNIKKRTEFNKEEDAVSDIITDNLLSYETVKLFAQEKQEEKRLRQGFGPWLKTLWAYANSFRLIDIAIGLTSNLGVFLILWLALEQVGSGKMTPGELIMVISFMGSFYYQFFVLVYRLRDLAKRYADIGAYFKILDEEIIIKDPAKPKRLREVKGEVEFENVDFLYPGSKKKSKALKKINLAVHAGETVALVGRSGAGKTTLVKLLLRFYDPDKGKILLDGVDIRQITKQQLRSTIGVVPQEPILFNNTIAYNVTYGNEGVATKEIVKAAQIANIHQFIRSLPDGYQTMVGERGVKLSGGQKQRLAIARMLLSRPKLIVFDEATSNLDSESEKLIQEALWKIAENRTVFIIAHRFATIRRANRIIVLENGRIAETGSHSQLIKIPEGIYRRLWQLQVEGKITLVDSDGKGATS